MEIFWVGLKAEKLNQGGGGQNPKGEGYNVVDDKNPDEGEGWGVDRKISNLYRLWKQSRPQNFPYFHNV